MLGTTSEIVTMPNKLGIGTTTPTAKLDVSGNVLIKSTHPGGATYMQHTAQLRIQDGTDDKTLEIGVLTNGNGIIQCNEPNNGAGYKDLLLQPVFNGVKSGNVGIGTTSPSEKLDVNGNIKISNIIYGPGGNNASIGLYPNTTSTDSKSWMELAASNLSMGAESFFFYCNSTNANYGVHAMRILQNGNVGIGTDNPTGKLHVNSNSASLNCIFQANYQGYGNGENVNLIFKNGAFEMSGITGIDESSYGNTYLGGLVFKTKVHHTMYERMRISAGGQVGIGTTSLGSYKLNVNGPVNATSYNASSDYRIKENVIPISDTSYNIDNIRPVTYTNTKMEKQDFGVIAHELQEQMPFLVTGEKDGEHHQSVNYNGLIGLLLNEVQQLKKRVQELEQSKP